MREKPLCQSVYPWLTANLGKRCLAGMTSTDVRALNAAVHLVELYGCTGEASALQAWAACVKIAQPTMRRFFYHATAHVRDWGHRREMWQAAGLPPLDFGRCEYEPR